MENALNKDFPAQTTSPLQRDHDGDDITRAKICGPIMILIIVLILHV